MLWDKITAYFKRGEEKTEESAAPEASEAPEAESLVPVPEKKAAPEKAAAPAKKAAVVTPAPKEPAEEEDDEDDFSDLVEVDRSAEAPAEDAFVPPAFDVTVWQKSQPLDYLMRDGEVAALAYGREFSLLEEEDQVTAAEAISDAITAAMDKLAATGDDQALWDLTLAMTDAMYGAALRLVQVKVYAQVVSRYIGAVGRPFYSWLTAHGMQMNYCVNCEGDDVPHAWREFPEFFAASGLVYACPQNMAYVGFERGAVEGDDYAEKRENFINDAFFVVRRMLKNSMAQGRSIICVDADANPRTFEKLLACKGKPGYLVVERTGELFTPAVQKVQVWYPETNVAAADV